MEFGRGCEVLSWNHRTSFNDEKAAKLHLPAPGAALKVLTQEQLGYTGVEIEGPFSRVVTTVRKDWLFTSSPHSYIERLSPLSSLVRLGTPVNTHSVPFFVHVPGTQMVVAQVERRLDELCGGQDWNVWKHC